MPDRQCVTMLLSPKPRKILLYCNLTLRTSHNWNSPKRERLIEFSSTGGRKHHRFSPLPTDQDVRIALGRSSDGAKQEEGELKSGELRLRARPIIRLGARPTIFL